jgi:hypothetical protein
VSAPDFNTFRIKTRKNVRKIFEGIRVENFPNCIKENKPEI